MKSVRYFWTLAAEDYMLPNGIDENRSRVICFYDEKVKNERVLKSASGQFRAFAWV